MKLPALTLAALMASGAASASTTGFTLTFSSHLNIPLVSLSNSGDLGDITGITLSLGDTTRNFDAAYRGAVTGMFDFTLGPDLDTNTGGRLRADSIDYTFVGFNPGEAFSFRADVDIDNRNSVESYIDSVLPGGSIVVNFSGGLTDSLFVDLTPGQVDPSQRVFTYGAQVVEAAAVPLPAGLPLMLLGLGALGIARRKRT